MCGFFYEENERETLRADMVQVTTSSTDWEPGLDTYVWLELTDLNQLVVVRWPRARVRDNIVDLHVVTRRCGGLGQAHGL